jgi:hypothetical protein
MQSGTLHQRRFFGALALACALLAPCVTRAERNVDTALRKASQAGDLAEMQHQLELGAEPNQAYAQPSSRRASPCIERQPRPRSAAA